MGERQPGDGGDVGSVKMRARRLLVRVCGMFAAVEVAAMFVPATFAADKIVLQLKWTHQAQFAGYYVARENGYYADEDLEVDIRPLEAIADVPSLVAGGGIDVAVEWMPAALRARERGIALVNIAQPFRRSGYGLICRRDANIRTLDDMRGKKISHWPGENNSLPLIALLAKLDINAETNWFNFDAATDVHLVAANDLTKTLRLRVANCMPALSYNEVKLAKAELGENEVTVFSLETLGLSMLEDGLYVLESRLEDAAFRDVMARFVSASMKGWQWAEANQEEATDIVVKVLGDIDARAHQRYMMGEVAKLTAGSNGALDTGAYNRTVALLLESGIISGQPQGAWTSDITDAAEIYAADRFDRLLASMQDWFKRVFLHLLNPKSTLTHIGWALLVLSMFMRNQITLRLLVIGSSLSYVVLDSLFRFDYTSLVWTTLLLLPNIWYFWADQILGRFLKFTPAEEELIRSRMPELSRVNCHRVLSKGQWHVAEKDEMLAQFGQRVTHLYYVASGGCEISRGDKILGRMSAPYFVGHRAITSFESALWSTKPDEGTHYWSIPADMVRKLMDDNNEIHRALSRIFLKRPKNTWPI